MNPSASSLLSCNNVSKSYHVGQQDINVLFDITIDIKREDFVVIFGPSGCGKSTLLHILLGLEVPTVGKVVFDSVDLYADLDEDGRAVTRKQKVGMVYQQPNWIKALTVIENVAFPLVLNGVEPSLARETGMKMLGEFSMGDWAMYRPGELSSGQQQKVALARSIGTNPSLIIADEPTGNLDYESGIELMNILTTLNKSGKTVIMVTHDLDYLAYASVAIEMLDGRVQRVYNKNEISEFLLRDVAGRYKKRGVVHNGQA